jgi:hypothetical protein
MDRMHTETPGRLFILPSLSHQTQAESSWPEDMRGADIQRYRRVG